MTRGKSIAGAVVVLALVTLVWMATRRDDEVVVLDAADDAAAVVDAPVVADAVADASTAFLGYDAHVARLAAGIDGAAKAGAYLAAAELARRRAELTGRAEDFEAARALYARAAASPELHLGAARLEQAAGRWKEARAHLEKAGVTNASVATWLEQSLAVGDYADAERWLGALGTPTDTAGLLAAAHRSFATGDATGARRLMEKAVAVATDPVERAQVLLAWGRAELARGDAEEAAARLDEAAFALPGWWQVELEQARSLAARGQTVDARGRLNPLARAEHPVAMSALASVLAEEGSVAEAEIWEKRAARAFDARLEAEPRLAPAAVRHYVEHGPPERAVATAESLHRARPDAEAKVLLAQAYLAAGDARRARKTIDEALASPWKSAELYATAAEAYEATGDEARAAELREEAEVLLPAHPGH